MVPRMGNSKMTSVQTILAPSLLLLVHKRYRLYITTTSHTTLRSEPTVEEIQLKIPRKVRLAIC
jgi:hypothetical protein